MMGQRSDEIEEKISLLLRDSYSPSQLKSLTWTYCYHFKLILQNIISFSWLEVDCTTILTVLTHRYLQTYN